MKHLMVITILDILLCCTLSAQQATINMTGNDNPNATYKLYQTNNMWTFLKLNTQDGKI